MHQRERGFEVRVVQVAVIGAQLEGQEHALVDQRAAGHRHDVEIVVEAAVAGENPSRNHLAQQVERALELLFVGHARAAPDENLAVEGLGDRDFRRLGEAAVVDRHVAPAEQRLPFLGDHLAEDLLHLGAHLRVLRQEDVTDRVVAGFGQREAELLRLAREELVRDLHQHARAVAHQRVGADGAAVRQVLDDPDAALDDLVRGLVLQVDDEADAAGIALVQRVKQAGGSRTTGGFHRRSSRPASSRRFVALDPAHDTPPFVGSGDDLRGVHPFWRQTCPARHLHAAGGSSPIILFDGPKPRNPSAGAFCAAPGVSHRPGSPPSAATHKLDSYPVLFSISMTDLESFRKTRGMRARADVDRQRRHNEGSREMEFASDNWSGASPRVITALAEAAASGGPAYGGDALTAKVEARFAELFETDVAVLLVGTGTAANALSLSAFAKPGGLVLAHADAHINVDEAGAAEFLAGAKIVPVAADRGKLDAAALAALLSARPSGVHHGQPIALSITQLTEFGAAYQPAEVAALTEIAHRYGMGVHMDGARFANAVAATGSTPADLTWRAGIDILSFGGTKNGCLAAEAVVVFDRDLARDIAFNRQRLGQGFSKNWVIAAQFDAYLTEGHWLDLARAANDRAAALARVIEAAPGARLAFRPDGNQVFAILDRALDARLRAAGAVYHPWAADALPAAARPAEGEVLVRLVTSWRTRPADVSAFADALAAINKRGARRAPLGSVTSSCRARPRPGRSA